MNRQNSFDARDADPVLRVASQAVRITSYVGQKRRDAGSGLCTVPWVYLDALAEALRAAGIEPNARNLGKLAREDLSAARERAADRLAALGRYAYDAADAERVELEDELLSADPEATR